MFSQKTHSYGREPEVGVLRDLLDRGQLEAAGHAEPKEQVLHGLLGQFPGDLLLLLLFGVAILWVKAHFQLLSSRFRLKGVGLRLEWHFRQLGGQIRLDHFSAEQKPRCHLGRVQPTSVFQNGQAR